MNDLFKHREKKTAIENTHKIYQLNWAGSQREVYVFFSLQQFIGALR